MQIHRTDDATEHIVTVEGSVSAAQAEELRVHLFEALSRSDTDVVLDAREATAFDDAALTALTAARSRARFHQHRIVVVDREGGPLSASLHRTGLLFRFLVYPDPAAAAAGLQADRDTLSAMDFPLEAKWRAIHAQEEEHSAHATA